MPENVRSGWSNLLLLQFKKNVVNGSCAIEKVGLGYNQDFEVMRDNTIKMDYNEDSLS